jgi:aminomethyltransferase
MNAPVLVPRGLLPTPFDARTAPLNLSRAWQPWARYATAAHFDSVEAEYFAIRNQATLFDVSAMRKFRIRGPDALRVMNRLVTRDLRKLRPGRVTYALWCDEDGMVIDDGTVFRLGENDFRLCCQEAQYGWLLDVGWGFDVTVVDESGTVAGLSLQGPTSFAVLEDAGLGAAGTLKAFDLAEIDGILISRTGFTGDLGYELWVPPARALALWGRLWGAGRLHGLRPIGYDALDLARLEAGFILAGRDYVPIHHASRPTRGRTPFELGYSVLVDLAKDHFKQPARPAAPCREGPALRPGRPRRRRRQARIQCAGLLPPEDRDRPRHLGRLVADLQAQSGAGHAQGALRRDRDLGPLGRNLSRQGG